MSHPKAHSLRPRGRQGSSFRANQPTSNSREGAGEAGRRSASASGWMSTAECLTLGTVWCLAKVTRRIARKNTSPPLSLKVSVARFGISIHCHSKPCHNGGRHSTTDVVGYRREPCKVRDLVILFITGFVNDRRLVMNHCNHAAATTLDG